MRTDGWPPSPTVPSANAVGSGRRSTPTSRASASSAVNRSNGSRRGASGGASLIATEDAAEQRATEPTEHAAFLDARAAGTRRRRDDAVGETRERHRLEDHAAGPRESGEEEPFAAEERRLDAGHHLDVVAN